MEGKIFETKQYGKLKVIKQHSYREVDVEFLETGYKTTTRKSHILDGNVKDKLAKVILGVACIGDGPYKASKKHDWLAYQTWFNMLCRCYDESNNRFYTYGAKGVAVCDEWLNFQKFAEWYYENKTERVDHIDKDLLSGEIKVYSPETCVFVSRQFNAEITFSKEFSLKTPSGEIVHGFNLTKFCREHDLSQGHMAAVLRGERNHHKGYTKP